MFYQISNFGFNNNNKFFIALIILLSLSYTIQANDSDAITYKIADFHKKYEGKYDLNITASSSDKKVPLFIVLPGWVGNKKFTDFKNSLITPALENANGIIFSPSISWKSHSAAKLEQIIKDFIATATQNLSVDPQKIVLIGYSRGAMEAINLTKNNDTTFSALIIMASNFKFKNKLSTPIHVIQGTKDKFFPISKARKNIIDAKSKGCNILFTEVETEKHITPADYIKDLNSSIPWLQNTIW
ncbi:hypothetical protein HN014_12500 [Aquimarina sp. TRL1]|uniref:dienelactone hydrolase family protein n=1 Tax=Aquimarina sp. (strain TRL1) TaxID=2736252 RepID=UPI00158C6FD5|nr:dienelactone hydrolase family protein [Aquimarina sp. TRL1]QKX05693.1 hypothetical protein HN014_12500 [Aquimarina sp. TRL1]